MSRISRLTLAALATTLVLWAAVGTASARRFEISPAERGMRATWARFEVLIGYGEFRVFVTCPVTLEGTLHSRTISKVSGLLLGFITRAAVNEAACTAFLEREFEEIASSAKLQLLTETLPWHVRYVSFQGILPRITSVSLQVVGAALRVYELPSGERCLYRSTAAVPMRYMMTLGESGDITGLEADETILIPKSEGSILCASSGLGYHGTGSVTQLGSTARLSVRLVS